MANVQLGSMIPTSTESVVVRNAATGLVSPATLAATASPAALMLIARQVGEGLKAKSAGLDYHVDMIGGMPRIRIIDSQTQQIIRQIPTDEVLTLHRALGRSEGVLLRDRA